MNKYFILATLILLVGCNTYSGPRRHATGANLFFTNAAAGKSLPVVVVGNPLDTPKKDLENLIISGLDNSWSYLRANFQAAEPSAATSFRIVFVFNPAHEVYRDNICSANQSNVAGGQGVTEIVAAFCGEKAYSELRANIETAQSLNDKNLADAIEYMTWQIVPKGRRYQWGND